MDNPPPPKQPVMIERIECVDYHQLIASNQFAVVMFFVSWDPGSHQLLSQLKRVAMTGERRVALGFVDFEKSKESNDLAGELQLHATPALVFFRDGAQVALLYGGHHTISDQIEQLVAGTAITPSREPWFPGPRSKDGSIRDPIVAAATPSLWKRFQHWILGDRTAS